MEGYVKIWRKILESPVWENHNLFYFWCWCLMKATYKARVGKVGYQDVPLEPGQFIFGRHIASKETGLSIQTIRTCLHHLETMQNLTVKSTNKFSIITVTNWSKYQDEPTSKLTNNQPASNQQVTTDKKGKKGNKVKNIYTPLFIKFWDIYPRKEAKVKALSAFNVAVKERVNGYTEETFADMLIVAVDKAKKTEQWMDNIIPHPATWLNGKRWEDEQPKESKRASRRIL